METSSLREILKSGLLLKLAASGAMFIVVWMSIVFIVALAAHSIPLWIWLPPFVVYELLVIGFVINLWLTPF